MIGSGVGRGLLGVVRKSSSLAAAQRRSNRKEAVLF
jgi:hypothetical protein